MPNTYTLLEQITVGAAGASSVTFNSIPQTGYTDLVIKMSTRDNYTGASYTRPITIKFNGSATSFSEKFLYGDGSAAASFSSTSGNIAYDSTTYGTANTFANGEIYVPNYTSSNYKSFSTDNVSESNIGTGPIASLVAGLWSNTAAITSVSIVAFSGYNFTQHSTFSLYGVSALGTTPTKAPKATGGSIIQTDGTYWYHAFLSSGTFTPAVALSCDYLVVAGGGGAGSPLGGGGGAGGLRSTVTATGGGGALESALSLASGTGYTVTVGAGGALNANGSNSVFSTITSTGGGRGGYYDSVAGATGGSGGGGGGGDGNPVAGGSGTTNQGYAGGGGRYGGTTRVGGGGGGAGAVGATGVQDTSGGAGGAGVQISALATTTATGVSGYYAGGGGGTVQATGTPGAGGAGGGGAGGQNVYGTNGTPNTGGGGGGGQTAGTSAGSGGSGIVIIRYLAA